MTREEAIDYIVPAIKNMWKEKVCVEIIEALKAEPCEDVLDEMRAEIASLEEGISSYFNDRPWVFKDEVLRIIDKYKEGSEEV